MVNLRYRVQKEIIHKNVHCLAYSRFYHEVRLRTPQYTARFNAIKAKIDSAQNVEAEYSRDFKRDASPVVLRVTG